MSKKYKEWTLIDWDGNPELGYKCWRKSFRRGHVSVGVGDFAAVVFSYGADSESSFSSTRWRILGKIPPEMAMKMVDQQAGKTFSHAPWIVGEAGRMYPNVLFTQGATP